MQFDEVDKATIQVVERHLEVIFSILTNPKFHFGQVEKSMFQMVSWYWKLIFFLLTSPKYDVSRARMAL